jgi:hypothetical protein
MIISKIDGTICKNILGLSTHLKQKNINLTILEYYIKYENYIIPKCIHCENDAVYMKGLTFRKTCGSSKCKIDKSHVEYSEETKEKMRKARHTFLKSKSGKSAWERRANGEFSYLESWFSDKCTEYELYKIYDICYDYSVYPYFIDFAFLNVNVAVELDGKCHFDNGDKRLEHDTKKDNKLIEKGWRVFRIKYNEIKDDTKILELIHFISTESSVKNYDERLYRYKEIKKIKTDSIKKIKIKTNKKGVPISDLIEMILNSGIDFSKFGWVNKVSELLGISENKGGVWVRQHMPEFYNSKCFVRKR